MTKFLVEYKSPTDGILENSVHADNIFDATDKATRLATASGWEVRSVRSVSEQTVDKPAGKLFTGKL